MRQRVRGETLYGVLLWAQRVLFSVAILLIGYCAFGLTEALIFQHRQSAALEQLTDGHDFGKSSTPGKIPPDDPDGLIGRIEVRRLGISVVLVEGSDDLTLRHAVGHIAGTSLPGEPGNAGIAGHRDTFFRPLRNIRKDDVITVTTPQGRYTYRVLTTRIVDPSDVSVLDQDDDEILTLVTCYPFYFVGPSPSRFIVRAARVPVSEVGRNRGWRETAWDEHQATWAI